MTIIRNIKAGPIQTQKLKKIPETLVYRGSDVINAHGKRFNRFALFETRANRKCFMRCYPEKITRDNQENVPSLYISNIISVPQMCGLGTKMLNFAKKISEKCGCNGYFHLTADDCYTPHKIPHVFYWKSGMNSNCKRYNDKLEYFVWRNKDATYKDFPHLEMYYPPIKHPKFF